METAGSKQPSRETPGVRATPPAGRAPRSHDLPPRPFHRAPHSAGRVSIPALTLSSETRAPPHSRLTFLRTRPSPPPRSHSRRVHNEFHPPALPPSRGPAGESRSLRGAEPQRTLRVAGKRKGDRCALKVNSNTACKLLGCSPERAPAGTLPQRRALPQGLPGLQTPRDSGVAGGPANPAAPVHLSTCPAPGAEPDPTPPPTDASAFSSPRQSLDPPLSRRGLGAARPAPAIPLGVPPPPLAAHLPQAPFTSGKAALRTQPRHGVEGRLCASGLSRGRGPVSRGRGRPTRRAARGPFRGPGRRKPQLLSGIRLARLSAPALL